MCWWLATGCLGLKPEVAKPLPAGFPEHFAFPAGVRPEAGEGAECPAFTSPELKHLIELALQGNFSLAQARARLEAARWQARKTGALKYPELDLDAGRSRLKFDDRGRPAVTEDRWRLGGAAAYEVDLWGRIAALTESELARYAATREDLESAALSLGGSVAETWVSLITNRRHFDLLQKQLKLQKKLLEVVARRFPLGRATVLDIYQQQQIIEKLKSAVVPARYNQEVLLRRLALLAGRPKLPPQVLRSRAFPALPPLPQIGLPADLLALRPDIRAAARRFAAEQWAVAAARADRLPALRLTASGDYHGEDFNAVFDNWIINLAAGLTAPLFDGGRRRAEVARRRALLDEKVAHYREVVLNALHEVEDALTRETEARHSLKTLRNQLAISRSSLREARRRYLNGNSDFLNVLNEELNTLQLEHDIINQQEALCRARIALCRALGREPVCALSLDPATPISVDSQ
jgi:NodT family efflux transporter outer membrane factor (OMF) lipoprotein